MRVLILGGYGNFGALIARELARDAAVELLLAGRSADAARRMATHLAYPDGARIEGVALDIDTPDLQARFAEIAPDLIIHTCGPFQRRDYHVAAATLAAGAHYIDLADARDFVVGITALDARARECGRLVVAGASTVPGLSGAVIDRYCGEFELLTDIDIGISPGNRTPRGTSTVAAILGYVGQRLPEWSGATWRARYGWQNLHRQRYPEPIGKRWLSLCDVPDIALFPSRYPGLRNLRFGAGLELSLLHLGLWLLSWLVRWRLLPRLDRWTATLKRISEWFLACGSDAGAMHVRMSGTAPDGKLLCLTWTLIAGSGHGPQIPAMAAVVLVRKLARGECSKIGAMACLDLFGLEEYLAALAAYDIHTQVQRERK